MYVHAIDHVGLLFIKEKKLLFTKLRKSKEWRLPGGKIKKDETYIKALNRIIPEQISTNIISKSIKFSKSYVGQSYGQSGGIKIKLTCFTAKFDGKVEANKKTQHQIKFLSHKDKKTTNIISQMVFDDLKHQGIIT